MNRFLIVHDADDERLIYVRCANVVAVSTNEKGNTKIAASLNSRDCIIECRETPEQVFASMGYKQYDDPVEAAAPVKKREKDPVLDKEILDLPMSIRPINCLRVVGINTVRELIQLTELDLRRIPNMGRKSIKEIKDALAELGLSLK